jgi:hypothetical protein
MALPADSDEINRLRIQHKMLKLLVGDTLDDAIATSLASSDGRQRRVLEVRTQTGIW